MPDKDALNKAVGEAVEKVATAVVDEVVAAPPVTAKEPARPIAGNSEGLWQKLFMGLLSLVFAVLAGAYVKLANDVAITSDIATKALDSTSRIEERLRVMDTADQATESAERDRLQSQVEELERQRRRDDLEPE